MLLCSNVPHYNCQEREKGIGESTRAKDRESTLREVNKLKSSIQTLTKSAHPLGKLMDFLQEDVDSMQVRGRILLCPLKD